MSLRLFILPKNLCVSNNASHLSPFTLTHGYVQRANTAQRESTPHSRQSKTNKGRVCHVLWDITTCADPVSAASTVLISKFKIVTLILRWTIKLYHFNHGSGVFDCLKRMTITCWVVYSTFLLSLKLSGRELAGRLLWRSLFFALANVVSWCFNAHSQSSLWCLRPVNVQQHKILFSPSSHYCCFYLNYNVILRQLQLATATFTLRL